jgi:hypothetical protein
MPNKTMHLAAAPSADNGKLWNTGDMPRLNESRGRLCR